MSKTIKTGLCILCMLALVVCAFPTMSARADDGRTITDVQKEIGDKQKKIQELADEIDKNKSNSKVAEALLAEYQQAYDEVAALIDEQEVLINNTADALDAKGEELNETMQRIADNKELYTERLRAIYTMNMTNAGMQLLLGAGDYSDMVAVGEGLKHISQRDTEMLQELADEKTAYEQQKEELEGYIERLGEELEALQAQRDENEAMMDTMRARISQYNYQVKLNQQEKEVTEDEKDALVAELNRLFQESQGKGSQEGDGSTRHEGPLMWPVNGKIPNGGYFGDPRSNTGWHYGIDISAAGGTPIVAAAGGTVITSTWHYSYGYYIEIDHGQGLRTLYAHCSELYVGAGTTVEMGSTIAAVGSTGDSTGNHLHFEVHEHGSRQNPLGSGYLNP